jgi:hypothetical protein
MLNSRTGKGTLAVCVFVLAWSLMSSTALFAQLELASHDPRPAEIDSLFSASNRPDVPGWAVGIIQMGGSYTSAATVWPTLKNESP